MIAQKFQSILSKKKRANIARQMIIMFEVSKSTVSNWLHGRVIPPKIYWVAIADIFGEDIAVLFPNDADNKTSSRTTNNTK